MSDSSFSDSSDLDDIAEYEMIMEINNEDQDEVEVVRMRRYINRKRDVAEEQNGKENKIVSGWGPNEEEERRFDIDDGSLEGTYKNWQKKLHPDLVHTKSKEEREYAAEQSARVIDAYTTLRKPLKRAIYIMRLEGVEVDEEQTVSEPELLGEIMEIREAVEEATNSQDLNKIQSEMEEKLSHWSDIFGNAFGSNKYDEALKAIQRMTYYHRVKEEIVKKL
ncbi:iron-sulfur cluster co-chaperone protein HscB [Tanacetum coccineum]